MSAEARVSVCVVCRNEADRLAGCLDSVRWADEVIVMDLASSDDSASVAAAHGARVVTHEPVPIVELARNEVAAHASGEWILALDPDERVTPALAAELRRLSGVDGFDAVAIPFRHLDFGHEPSSALHRFDAKPRFYRRRRVSWPTLPNELPQIAEDRLHRLPFRDDLVIVHERSHAVAESLDRIARYAPAEAQAMLDAGEAFTAAAFLRRMREKAAKQFVDGRAFDDGMPGVVRATELVAFHFWVWAAFWQLSGARRTPEDDRLLRRVGLVFRLVWASRRLVTAPRRIARRLRG